MIYLGILWGTCNTVGRTTRGHRVTRPGMPQGDIPQEIIEQEVIPEEATPHCRPHDWSNLLSVSWSRHGEEVECCQEPAAAQLLGMQPACRNAGPKNHETLNAVMSNASSPICLPPGLLT